jgi:nucleotide-binding universal stress UspA family protein
MESWSSCMQPRARPAEPSRTGAFSTAWSPVDGQRTYPRTLSSPRSLQRFDMWKHLLVPLDFSECSHRALDVALGIALRERASLTLLHVTPLPPNLPPDALVTPPGATAQVRIDDYTCGAVRARLDSIAVPLRDRGVDVLAVATASHDVADEVLRAVAEVRADAIVIGTHGRTALYGRSAVAALERIDRRLSAVALKVHGLPDLYWNGVLRGRA